MKHVLIVEDLEDSRYLLQTLLEGNGYRVTAAGDGLEALAAARRELPDIIVSDALMPKMDGFSLCRAWMQDDKLRNVPFVFYSATYTTPDDEKLAIALGAVRYIVKPQEPEALLFELNTVLQSWVNGGAPRKESSMDDSLFFPLHDAVLTRKLEHKISELEVLNRSLVESEAKVNLYVSKLESAVVQALKVAMTMGEMRDPYTAGHEQRVAEIAVAIGAELGFDEKRQLGLRIAGYVHDVGKIMIPAELLAKPSRLSPHEFLLIKEHPRAGYDILKNVECNWPVADVAWQHHERMDGTGYPQGLKGEAILMEARIMAVADVVEAMSSHRPYRPGLGIDRALAEIERGRGTSYDANAVDACLRLFREKGFNIDNKSSADTH